MVLLRIGWMFFGVELLIALSFGLVLWYFWTHSAVSRPTVLKAIGVYALGCVICLLVALLVPL